MPRTHRSLASLARGIRRCRRCPLHAARTHAVPGEGDAHARIVLVGEAPGESEDRSGRPFTGRAGRFLDELLDGAGLTRGGLFITSGVKCRPPGNRNPRAEELATCRENWLTRQLDAIDPQWVLLMGRMAIVQTFGPAGRLSDLHGQIHRADTRRYMLTYHPAAGMRFPAAARAMREDFKRLADLARRTDNGGRP